MLTKSDFEYIYQLLDDVTPLFGDCGELCSRRCCSDWDDQDDVGMYLLPGEEVMFSTNEDWLVIEKHSTIDYEFPPSWEGEYYFVKCIKPCPRDKRPFECRTFPLIPYYNAADDTFDLIMNPDGIIICPLVQHSDLNDLNPEFIKNLQEAWSILLEDPLIADDIKLKSAQWDQDPPWQKFFTE